MKKLFPLLGLLLFSSFVLADDSALLTTRVRIGAANLTSGKHQNYNDERGMRILQAAKPDVVAIQEFNYKDNSDAAIQEFVTKTFGPDFHYYREKADAPRTFKIPNGIISRYPIVESGTWPALNDKPDRGYAWAKIDLKNGQTLWMVSVHLLTKSPSVREREAEFLLQKLREKIPNPEKALIVIAGDFNTKNANEKAIVKFSELLKETRVPRRGDDGIGTNRNGKYKYDWVLPSPELEKWHVPLVLQGTETPEDKKPSVFPDGLVFDTRKMSRIPSPAARDDSEDEYMQHHLVIKDFDIPDAPVHAERPADATHAENQEFDD